MKFIIEQQNLNDAISIVQRAVSSKTTMEILKNIYIEANNNQLKLVGNDLSTGIEIIIDANVVEKGKCVINSKLFSEIVRKLPDSEITVIVNEDFDINIKCLNSEFNLTGLNPIEYPNVKSIENAEMLNINKYLLKDMIRQTVFATSQDETRPILTGALLEVKDNTMIMVGIDLFRVAMRKTKINSEKSYRIVIPAVALNEIYKILSLEEVDEYIRLDITDKYLQIILNNIKIVTRLLEGEFLNYEQIIPTQYKSLVTFSKESMYRAIDRASLVARESKNVSLLFDISDNKLNILSNVEIGSAKESVDIQLEGPSLKIGFNPKYWLDVLKVIDTDEIQMELTTNSSPCILKPVGNDNYTYLVLPVRIIS